MLRGPSRVVLGNATLTESEFALLESVLDSPHPALFTSNAGFNSEVAHWNWHRRVAVMQDYVFQALKSKVREQLIGTSNPGHMTVIVESNYANVVPGTFQVRGTKVLSQLAQRRLLNGVARGRYFGLSHQYLPSTGAIALALALREVEDPHEQVALVGFGLSTTELYEARPDTRGSEVFDQPTEAVMGPRQHFRSDALAIIAFSYHHKIVSLRPEVDALMHTWRSTTAGEIADIEGRPNSTASAVRAKLGARQLKFLFRKAILQLTHLRIPTTKQ